jgi:hypothetical protein
MLRLVFGVCTLVAGACDPRVVEPDASTDAAVDGARTSDGDASSDAVAVNDAPDVITGGDAGNPAPRSDAGGDASTDGGAIACLRSLTEPCAPSGACTTASNPALMDESRCYANGVTAHSTYTNDALEFMATVAKNGVLCYTATTSSISPTSPEVDLTFRNPAGATIAVVRITATSFQSMRLAVTCGGVTDTFDQSSPSLETLVGIFQAPTDTCTAGVCVP